MSNLSRDELSEIILKYRDTVFRVALGYVKNTHDSDDIAQNVFIKLYRYDKDFVTEDALKAWLIRVAINEAKDLLKSAWAHNRGDLDESLAAPDYDDDIGVYDYVKNLKPKYRTVIYLHYYEGYSTKEISKLLKMPQSTVTTQLNRARKQLKEDIERDQCDMDKEEERYGKLQGYV